MPTTTAQHHGDVTWGYLIDLVRAADDLSLAASREITAVRENASLTRYDVERLQDLVATINRTLVLVSHHNGASIIAHQFETK
jgi:hypothetical protein